MERVKIFKGSRKIDGVLFQGLENEINKWLRRGGDRIKITRVVTVPAEGPNNTLNEIVVMIFYKEE